MGLFAWLTRKVLGGGAHRGNARVIGKHYLLLKSQNPNITDEAIFQSVIEVRNKVLRYSPEQLQRLESAKADPRTDLETFIFELSLIEANVRLGPGDWDSPPMLKIQKGIAEELRALGLPATPPIDWSKMI